MKHLLLSLLVCLDFTACQKETKPVTFAVVFDLPQPLVPWIEDLQLTF